MASDIHKKIYTNCEKNEQTNNKTKTTRNDLQKIIVISEYCEKTKGSCQQKKNGRNWEIQIGVIEILCVTIFLNPINTAVPGQDTVHVVKGLNQ